jgi:hypothetical protein
MNWLFSMLEAFVILCLHAWFVQGSYHQESYGGDRFHTIGITPHMFYIILCHESLISEWSLQAILWPNLRELLRQLVFINEFPVLWPMKQRVRLLKVCFGCWCKCNSCGFKRGGLWWSFCLHSCSRHVFPRIASEISVIGDLLGSMRVDVVCKGLNHLFFFYTMIRGTEARAVKTVYG